MLASISGASSSLLPRRIFWFCPFKESWIHSQCLTPFTLWQLCRACTCSELKSGEKAVLGYHIFALMEVPPLEIIPNVNLTLCVCLCVHGCVCLHGGEAAAIASGCTPLYVSDLRLMKLKAWQLWGASADPQSDGHLIPPPFPRGVTHIWALRLLFARWLGAPPAPRTRAVEGHATYAADAIWKVCLTATELLQPRLEI